MKSDEKRYKRILVTSALPYANGPIHLGHLAGAYLPADIYVRYQKLKKQDVIYICGADEHGVPISIAAEKEGIPPQSLVDRYWADQKETFSEFGINFDNYSRTSLPIHHETAKAFFKQIYDKDYLAERGIRQFYCEHDKRWLADRFIEGTCPICGAKRARGDQCEACGSSLEQTDLKEPYCKICGRTPVLRDTKHLFLKLNEFQEKLEIWLAGKMHWKENVLNYCKGWFREGLNERAVTRDLYWGIQVPIEGFENKVIYVWFEAPIGYISSTKEWADKKGQPDLWKKYWLDPDTKMVHFIGKDNIVFHAVIWPAMLMGHGDFILPAEIPANEFLNLEGGKLSTSRNYAVWLGDYLKKFPPDALRYYLAINAPETRDADFTWQEFQQRSNGELADILGNFVNRTLTFAKKQLNGEVPVRGELDVLDRDMLKNLAQAPQRIGALLETFELRKATYAFMDVARSVNKYFNDQEPWRTVKKDKKKCETTINVCIHAVRTLAVLMGPFIPFSAEKTWSMLGLSSGVHDQAWDTCGQLEIPAGHKLGKDHILFSKIEDSQIQPEIDRLRKISEDMQKEGSKKDMSEEPEAKITYEDFSKVHLKTARILKVERIEKADKLLKLEIEVGPEKRQIVAGIAQHYTPDELIGRYIVVVANLQPAKIRGVESDGMLLTAEDDEGRLALLTLDRDMEPGATVR